MHKFQAENKIIREILNELRPVFDANEIIRSEKSSRKLKFILRETFYPTKPLAVLFVLLSISMIVFLFLRFSSISDKSWFTTFRLLLAALTAIYTFSLLHELLREKKPTQKVDLFEEVLKSAVREKPTRLEEAQVPLSVECNQEFLPENKKIYALPTSRGSLFIVGFQS